MATESQLKKENMKQNETEEQQLRPLHCELNILSRPDGSAMLTTGDTAVLAAVYGPIGTRLQKILIDKAQVEAIYRPKAGLPCVTDRMREALIRNTCEIALVATLYPRTSISIILQEMQDSGGLLACSVNAACMAIINSGIYMKYLVAGIHSIIDQEDNVVLDPNSKQQNESRASITFVFDSVNKNVVASHTEGSFTQVQYQESLLKCRLASAKIFMFYRDIVNKYANRI